MYGLKETLIEAAYAIILAMAAIYVVIKAIELWLI